MLRYALAILDNPKLEAMWPFEQNLSITVGGIMVHLNPYLCPGKINPLVNDILKWNRSDTQRSIDISETTNGNAAACELYFTVLWSFSFGRITLSKKLAY